jgi:TatD DNase family protein
MRLIDTHFHLDLNKEENSVINEIEKNGIYTIAVTNAPSVYFHTKRNCQNLKFIRAALGYHPEVIAQRPNELKIFKEEIQSTRYIGEIGLDNSLRNAGSFIKQKEIFSQIINLCNAEENKILSIHSRNADNDILEIMGKSFQGKAILHYYTGTIKNMNLAISRGFYFSINLNMTQSKTGKKLIAEIPIECILTESDYPFLDNGISHMEYLKKTLTEIGKIKGLPYHIIEHQVFENMKIILNE